jgi:NAD(P)-dependent dehydrogenase (short-subunit alcohol dehydrogenase family)
MIDLNTMLGLKGKTALITGAASGIGFQVARFLAQIGARVALLDIDETQGMLKEEIIMGEGGQAGFYPCDVRDSAHIKKR